MGYLISYPRCGRSWQRRRISCFLDKVVSPGNTEKNEILKNFHMTHLGFGYKECPISRPTMYTKALYKGTRLALILRNAPGVVNSFFYNLRYRHNAPISTNIKSFVKGKWGVSRYCIFLNDLTTHINTRNLKNIRVYFYEDFFNSHALIEDLPWLLNISYVLTNQEKDFILNWTTSDAIRKRYNIECDRKDRSFRAARLNNYKETLPLETIDYINQYMNRFCCCEYYRERYCND